MKLMTAVMCTWIALCGQAHAIDCDKAKTDVERMICDEKRNPDLYPMDLLVNKLEAEFLIQKADQRGGIHGKSRWLIEIREKCKNAECIREAYQERIFLLQEQSTLCKRNEKIVYSCTLMSKEVISLCASPDAGAFSGYMQFRMGNSQKKYELEYPQKQTLAKENFGYSEFGDAVGHGVSFKTNGATFYVVEYYPSRNEKIRAGLIVKKNNTGQLKACIEEPLLFPTYLENEKFHFHNLEEELFLPNDWNEGTSK